MLLVNHRMRNTAVWKPLLWPMDEINFKFQTEMAMPENLRDTRKGLYSWHCLEWLVIHWLQPVPIILSK